jgi:hypothetical protein
MLEILSLLTDARWSLSHPAPLHDKAELTLKTAILNHCRRLTSAARYCPDRGRGGARGPLFHIIKET